MSDDHELPTSYIKINTKKNSGLLHNNLNKISLRTKLDARKISGEGLGEDSLPLRYNASYACFFMHPKYLGIQLKNNCRGLLYLFLKTRISNILMI